MTSNQLLTSSAESLVGKMIDAQARKVMPEAIVDVVNQHCKLAASAGLVPVPGADMVIGTANTLKMFHGINKMLGISSDGIDFTSIITSLMASGSSRLAVSGISNALKFIPAAGQVTGALLSATAQYTLTMLSGYVYFNALTLLVDEKGEISLDKLGESIQRTLADREKIDEFLEAIKSNATKLFDIVKEGVASAAGTVADGASSLYATASDGVVSAAGAVADGASSLYDTASGAVAEGANAAISKTKQVMDTAGKGLSALGKSITGWWSKK